MADSGKVLNDYLARLRIGRCLSFFMPPAAAVVLPDLSACRRGLIIKPSSLGDLVYTLPAVHLLKQRYPLLEWTWVVNPAFAPLLEGNPDLAGTLIFPRGDFRGLAGMWRFRRWLAEVPEACGAEVAVDFQGLLRSGLITQASKARIRIGFSDSREGAKYFHRQVIPVDAGAHAIERSLALPAALGISGPAVFSLPEGHGPAAWIEGEAALPHSIVLHPFSRGKGKSLSVSQTLQLCQALAPLTVLLVGQSDALLPNPLPPHVRNLLNRTSLPELIWLLRRARGVISVDSGPMHIAAALTPRVLSLHTWSDPRKVGPWHPGTTVWKAGHFMPTGTWDPLICAQDADFPDSAIPGIASWAHALE